MKITVLTVLFVSLALIAGTVYAEELKFAGCSVTQIAYMKDMAKAYEAKTGIKVDVKGGGATLGIKSAGAGTVDIGGTCRHLIEDEGKDVKLAIVAYDALVFIAHKSNPVSNVTKSQMINIFEGKIKNWKELGGEDKPIIVVERHEETDGARQMLNELLGHQIKLSDSAIQVQSSSEVEKEIEKNPYAFGVTGSSSATQRELKLLSYNGVSPNKENYLNGKYPLIRPLYLATKKGETSERLKKFFDFILSDEGQAVVSKNSISVKEYKKAREGNP